MADEDVVVFNGIDATTGRYDYPPTPLSAFAAAILGETFRGDDVGELKYHRRQPHFGTVHGVEPEDLAEAGWALIAAEDTPAEVLDALAGLRQLRREQAGARYRELLGPDGYRHTDDKRRFLARQGMGSALPADPDRLPYYVLLVGGPDAIPFSFQYQLDVQYAVGRIAFDSVADYRRYARAVVDGESADVPRTARLFGPRNDADRATKASSTGLIAPLERDLRSSHSGWDLTAVPPDLSTKDRLTELIAGRDAGLLFTAGHGATFPVGHAGQRSGQGGLVCQDWPGPLLSPGELARDMYFSAADADRLPAVGTRIMMSFACFGAGTPRLDDFPHPAGTPSAPIADEPFVAALPQRLLAHDSGGMLAFVGHVERAWGCSFVSQRVGPQHDVFLSTVRALFDGWRIGHAMEYFDNRYSALTAELHETIDGYRRSGDEVDYPATARLWTENNDARSYVVLGDPAVRLRNSAPRADGDG